MINICFKILLICLTISITILSYKYCDAQFYKYRQENGIWRYTNDIKSIPDNIKEVYQGDYHNWQLIKNINSSNNKVVSSQNQNELKPSDIILKSQQNNTSIVSENNKSTLIEIPYAIPNRNDDNSLILPILLILLGSIIRGWGILNHRRSYADAPLIASASILTVSGIFSIILGLIGAVLVGSETSFWIGLISFLIFWFFSGFWIPVLTIFRL